MQTKKYNVKQQVSHLQFKKYISTDFLSANSDKTLLSCSVIMGVALIYFIFSKNKNNDGDNQSPPVLKKRWMTSVGPYSKKSKSIVQTPKCRRY